MEKKSYINIFQRFRLSNLLHLYFTASVAIFSKLVSRHVRRNSARTYHSETSRRKEVSLIKQSRL